jgi:hypothetical protein
MKRSHSMSDDDQPFGFRWFIPEVIKQRSFFRDVALAAFVLYGLGLDDADVLSAGDRQGPGPPELCDADGV